MREDLINFNTASLAKSKGFGFENPKDEFVNYYLLDYYKDRRNKLTKGVVSNSQEEVVLCPTQAVLQAWLRDKHKIEVLPFFQAEWGVTTKEAKELSLDTHRTFFEYICFVFPLKQMREERIHVLPYVELIPSEYWIDGKFDTFEQALEVGLQHGLHLIK